MEEGVDIALRVRPTLDDSGSLVVKNLGMTKTFLVTSPEHLKRQGTPKSVQDLASLDSIRPSGIPLVVAEIVVERVSSPRTASTF